MTTQTLEVSSELAHQLQHLAEIEGRSVNEVLGDALNFYSKNLETTSEELDELKRRDAELDQLIAEGKMIPHEQVMQELYARYANREQPS